MDEVTNNTRAAWANTALSAFAVETHQVNAGDDDKTILGDLLCNFRHLADAHGWDIEAMWKASHAVYAEEVTEQPKADIDFSAPDACENCGNTLNDGSDICDQCGGAFVSQF